MIFRELLFPSKCVLCGGLLDRAEQDLCQNCRREVWECPADSRKIQFLDSWTAVWYYEGNVRGSLLRFKFGGRRAYAESYGRILAMRLLREHPRGFDVLTWVPISPQRRWHRGYDQVELLARAVGRALGMQPQRLLKKTRNNPPQSGISGQAERRANVLGAYRAVHPEKMQGKRVLLLDDICTTGATLRECARVLHTAGSGEIHCGVVAASKNHK